MQVDLYNGRKMVVVVVVVIIGLLSIHCYTDLVDCCMPHFDARRISKWHL